jgi:hypothetical protein
MARQQDTYDDSSAFLHSAFAGEPVLLPHLRLNTLSDFLIAAVFTVVVCLCERCVILIKPGCVALADVLLIGLSPSHIQRNGLHSAKPPDGDPHSGERACTGSQRLLDCVAVPTISLCAGLTIHCRIYMLLAMTLHLP